MNPKLEKVFEKLENEGFDRDFIRNKALPYWWDESFADDQTGFIQTVGILSDNLLVNIDSLFGGDTAITEFPASYSYKKNCNLDENDVKPITAIAFRLAEIVHDC